MSSPRQPTHFPIRWRSPRIAAGGDGAILGELLSVASRIAPGVRRRVSVELGGGQPLTVVTHDGWRVRVRVRPVAVGNRFTFTIVRAPRGKKKQHRALALLGAAGVSDIESPTLGELIEVLVRQ